MDRLLGPATWTGAIYLVLTTVAIAYAWHYYGAFDLDFLNFADPADLLFVAVSKLDITFTVLAVSVLLLISVAFLGAALALGVFPFAMIIWTIRQIRRDYNHSKLPPAAVRQELRASFRRFVHTLAAQAKLHSRLVFSTVIPTIASLMALWVVVPQVAYSDAKRIQHSDKHDLELIPRLVANLNPLDPFSDGSTSVRYVRFRVRESGISDPDGHDLCAVHLGATNSYQFLLNDQDRSLKYVIPNPNLSRLDFVDSCGDRSTTELIEACVPKPEDTCRPPGTPAGCEKVPPRGPEPNGCVPSSEDEGLLRVRLLFVAAWDGQSFTSGHGVRLNTDHKHFLHRLSDSILSCTSASQMTLDVRGFASDSMFRDSRGQPVDITDHLNLDIANKRQEAVVEYLKGRNLGRSVLDAHPWESLASMRDIYLRQHAFDDPNADLKLKRALARAAIVTLVGARRTVDCVATSVDNESIPACNGESLRENSPICWEFERRENGRQSRR